MNLKAKPMFPKEEGIYKIVDDFRKIKLFEVNCAPSCSHFRTSFGNIRQNWVGNIRIATALNGSLINVSDIDQNYLSEVMNFDDLNRMLAKQPGKFLEPEIVCRPGSVCKHQELARRRSWNQQDEENDTIKPLPLVIQGIANGGAYGQLNSLMTQSLQTTPIGHSAHRKTLETEGLKHAENTYLSINPADCTHNGSCMDLKMMSCQEYPRTIEITNFDLLNELRYSCGWRLESFPRGNVIRYRYEMFDVHMVYELTLQSRYDNSVSSFDTLDESDLSQQKLEGMYTVDIQMPSQTRDLKKHIYDTIKKEARIWDDILHLCNLIVNKFNTEWLKDYLRTHKSLVINEFVHNLNDQKATK